MSLSSPAHLDVIIVTNSVKEDKTKNVISTGADTFLIYNYWHKKVLSSEEDGLPNIHRLHHCITTLHCNAVQ